MANGHRWLFERREKDGTHRYYLRARVPKDVVHVVGRREVKRSLGTADRREALERINLAAAEVDEVFAGARRGLAARRLGDLAEADVRRMAFLWFRGADRTAAEADMAAQGDGLGAAVDEARLWAGTFSTGAEEEVLPHVQAVADQILMSHGWPRKPPPVGGIAPAAVEADVDKSCDQYWSLVDLVRRGMLESARRSLSRLAGRRAEGVDPMFDGTGGDVTATGPSLADVLDRWLAERKPPEKTAIEWRTAVRRFTEVNGDMPVEAVEKAHVRAFKDALLKLPAALPHRLRNLPVPEILAATRGGSRSTLSPAAVNKMITAVRSLLSWCERNGFVEGNVATGMGVARAKDGTVGRVPYGPEDLRAIFGSIAQFRETHPSRFWLPLLAVYAGARLDEIGTLTVDDVRREGGIDYVDINAAGEGKSVKTRSSLRQVPIHPELARIGFLRHVEARRAAGGGRLFPDLRPDGLGKLTGKFSKWWRRHARGLGIDDPRKVFHSFRHGFKEAARAAGVAEEVHDAITGHAGGGTGRGYGRVPLAVKAAAMAEVAYEFDPSGLRER